MRVLAVGLILLIVSLVGCSKSELQLVGDVVFEETWESLAQNDKEPDWFVDAKLGVYFHWGPYCVPAFKNEWYPRWMYIQDAEDWAPDVYMYGAGDWAKGIFDYHKNTFGDPKEFSYHDFIPLFKAEHFDAAEWADLFEKSGAKFAGPVAQHHDGFAMWGSHINPWNAKDRGPEKDVLGEIFKELKKRELRTIATFHHARNLQRYANDRKNWGGWNSHFPYHPDYATSSTDSELKYLYGNIPADEFYDYWLEQIEEVVDEYQPDMIWFDAWLDQIPEDYRKKMVAHQFNTGRKNGLNPLVAYKQEDIPRNVGILDMEQSGMKEMSPDYWMTDITLSNFSWSYVEGQTYKSVDLLIRNMIDVWSKKGIVLLNICPRSDGIINDQQRKILLELGSWLSTYGEAVYGTRTHSVFGYGMTEIEDGFMGEGQSATQEYSAQDVRFTTSRNGKTLYVFLLGMPEANTTLQLQHISPLKLGDVFRVSIVGSDTEIEWGRHENGLSVLTPNCSEMNEIATIFKVEFR